MGCKNDRQYFQKMGSGDIVFRCGLDSEDWNLTSGLYIQHLLAAYHCVNKPVKFFYYGSFPRSCQST